MTDPADNFIPGGPGTPRGSYELTGSSEPGETTEPRIFIVVERLVVGQRVTTRREVDLTLWLTKRPETMLGVEINAMLREVFYGR